MTDLNINRPGSGRDADTNTLIEFLGPVGFARFIQQFETGYGDYTKEKYEQPNLSFEELDKELQKFI